MKKRRHHYVWQHYLRAWTVGGKIACLHGGQVFTTSTTNVAVKTDFYDLKGLTQIDLQVIEQMFMTKASPRLRRLQAGWISAFATAVELSKKGDHLGADSAFAAAISNFEEDLHGRIESDAVPQLEALRNQDLGFLDSEAETASFFHFLSVQYLRTKKMKDTALGVISGCGITIPGFDLERAWGLFNHISANNIGYYLCTHRDQIKFTLLHSPEDMEFVTSDQPAINMQSVYLPAGQVPDGFDIYYPVSPRTALLLEADQPEGGRSHRVLEPEEVNDYNRVILKTSHQQVFSTRMATLRRLWESTVSNQAPNTGPQTDG
jgi:hypothetical protein